LGGTGVNSADLTLTSLTRSVGGGTVNFTAATGRSESVSSARIMIPTINGVSTSTIGGGLTNNLIGGWAIIGTRDFASYNPTFGVGTGDGRVPQGIPTRRAQSARSTPAGLNDKISIDSAVVGNITVTNDKTINKRLRYG